MNTWRKLWLSVVATALLASVLPAQAEVTWDAVKNKIKSAKDYQVTYKYNGPQGIFDFDYRWAGDKIRTEITNSKSDPTRRGTVIVFDKSFAADKVRAKTGGGVIVRNTNHKDVEGRPFHQSLFDMILGQVASLGKPTVTQQGKNTMFSFKDAGGTYNIWANENAEIVKTERRVDRTDETREFLTHRWNSSPKMDM